MRTLILGLGLKKYCQVEITDVTVMLDLSVLYVEHIKLSILLA